MEKWRWETNNSNDNAQSLPSTIYITCILSEVKWKVAQSCPTLWDPMDCSLPGPSVQWNSPSQNTGVGSHFLLQGIFTTEASNSCLLHCRWILYHLSHLQFSSVAQSCLTLCDPMNRRTPGLPVHHQLPEFTQAHVHRVGDAIQPSHPLSSPFPLAPNPSQHQSLFHWVNALHEVVKVLEF